MNWDGSRVATSRSTPASGAADLDRMRAYAKELVALQPDVLVGQTTAVTTAARFTAKPQPSPSRSVPRGFRSRQERIRPEPAEDGGNITRIHQHSRRR